MVKLSPRDAFGEELRDLGRDRPEIVALNGDLSGSTRTDLFAAAYPERFFNVGVAEQNLIGIAAGLALAGKVPFASSFAIFATGRAWEHIRQNVGYQRLNVKIVATHAGLTVGPDGASHQMLEDIALIRAIPNLSVVVPADAWETRAAVRAIAAYHGPVYLRLSRATLPVIFDPGVQFALGRSLILTEGPDLAICATGVLVQPALQAAERLRQQGIGATVINVSSIKPLDVETIITAAERTGAIVTAEEHSVVGGLGGAVAEVLGEHCPVPLERVGVRDRFGESGEAEELLQKHGLTVGGLVAASHRVLARKGRTSRSGPVGSAVAGVATS